MKQRIPTLNEFINESKKEDWNIENVKKNVSELLKNAKIKVHYTWKDDIMFFDSLTDARAVWNCLYNSVYKISSIEHLFGSYTLKVNF